MTLSINESKNGELKGVFEYSSGWKKASYNVVGTVTPTGTFQLLPGSWIAQPTGFRAVGLQGQVGQSGSKRVIDGTLPECKPGVFRAFLLPPVEKIPPPIAGMFDRKGPAWIKAIRDRIQEYERKRVANQYWWRQLEIEVNFSKVDRPTIDVLLAEIGAARASIGADALLAELSSDPKVFPQGIGQVFRIYQRAQRSDWPDGVKHRVSEVCKQRVAEVLRPKLTEIAASAVNVPTSLDGLAMARGALAPIEDYRQFLEQSFGTLDQENLLAPMWQKIAELESNPAIATEFQEAFAEARRQPDPRAATENVIRNVLDGRSTSETLAAIAAEGRREAALAEVVVESTASAEDRREPSANDMALFMYSVTERVNAIYAAMRCNPGEQRPVTDLPQCQLGELEVRLKKIVKTGCLAEKPGEQYVCDFEQYSKLVSFRTGEPVEGSFSLEVRFPGGRLEGPQKVRFVRQALGGGWDGSSLNPG
ncbi:hypothetical protein FHS21_005715 [Phyllobacterium trifolii]|uniref:Uncharacterized protein n=1 Tax=Phyllobacterium trifolii TaxID=300193 RepID=A0A839UHK4_9HYPH|nr:hypothetical protein [Phyllobacterium trifolii]MBB3149263.1 hypothetical protein [Phyllobacterium trifolii]